jgi:potassium-transporting ATPase KdpC subunit
MMRQLRPALLVLLVLTGITGILYPLLVTGIAQVVFPKQANGSLVVRGGQTIGSHLIGQSFTDRRDFWSRPSATSATPYDAAASSGSNLGPTNPALEAALRARIQALHESDPTNAAPIPVDLVTCSGSGLDPHISPAAAFWQVPRVARSRNLTAAQVHALVAQHVEGRTFGVLGEPRVNVLELNLALDAMVGR